MEEMVEPDRTIMIVSIIGLVVIWGSVAYHKFVQGGGPPRVEDDLPSMMASSATAPEEAGGNAGAGPAGAAKGARGKSKKKGKRR